MLLTALTNGIPITEFQPQNNKQAYLAYLNGLEIELPEPRTMEEALLYNYCVNGGGNSGGGKGTVEPLNVTENGTYTPPEGVDGYSPVNVMVAPPASDVDELISRNIEEVTSGVATVGAYAFANCEKLIVANFPNATKIDKYAFYQGNYAFQIEKELTVNAPNVETIGEHAFSCDRRAKVLLKRAYFPKVKTIDQYAFYQNCGLTEVYFPEAVSIGNYAFSTNQGQIPITNADFPKVTSIGANAFSACRSLITVRMPLLTSIGKNAFSGCAALTVVDFYLQLGFGVQIFGDCNSLKSLVLRSETMCTLGSASAFMNCYHYHGTVNSTYNPDGLKDGYIYVPRALVEDYKAETNWSTFSTQFRALEDYTVDGTITGELDETKI